MGKVVSGVGGERFVVEVQCWWGNAKGGDGFARTGCFVKDDAEFEV